MNNIEAKEIVITENIIKYSNLMLTSALYVCGPIYNINLIIETMHSQGPVSRALSEGGYGKECICSENFQYVTNMENYPEPYLFFIENKQINQWILEDKLKIKASRLTNYDHWINRKFIVYGTTLEIPESYNDIKFKDNVEKNIEDSKRKVEGVESKLIELFGYNYKFLLRQVLGIN